MTEILVNGPHLTCVFVNQDSVDKGIVFGHNLRLKGIPIILDLPEF